LEVKSQDYLNQRDALVNLTLLLSISSFKDCSILGKSVTTGWIFNIGAIFFTISFTTGAAT
jgi:hypothetical protein